VTQDKVFGRTNQWWWNAWDSVVSELKESDPKVAEFVNILSTLTKIGALRPKY
jgi:hypothetical protein